MNKRIGLLGGTFNPIHNGHIDLGLRIINSFDLSNILYILSANPPHKNNSQVVSTPLRWEMLTTALKPYKKLTPCDIEMQSPLPSWTINTVSKLTGASFQTPICRMCRITANTIIAVSKKNHIKSGM